VHLTDFHSGLRMTLAAHDRAEGVQAHAVQPINRTNLFNIIGGRASNDDIDAALRTGARAYATTLDYRARSHEEITSSRLMRDRTTSCAMPCRVSHRRLGHACHTWPADGEPHRSVSVFRYRAESSASEIPSLRRIRQECRCPRQRGRPHVRGGPGQGSRPVRDQSVTGAAQ
jgi:hypothetical protein